jgi:3-oxoacyl-[acyl-carrier-protein] synthase II
MLCRTAERAIKQAGLNVSECRTGIVIGLGRDPCDFDAHGDPVVNDEGYESHAQALARHLGHHGPLIACYSACASGNDAIGIALRILRRGEVDVVVCGAADAQIAPMPLIELNLLGALATECSRHNLEHPRPFDRYRSGFVLGEGAAIFVFERLDRAVRRSAFILGEVLGHGSSSDAHSLLRGQPSADGCVRAIEAALKDAEIPPDQVDYINAHGAGTVKGDVAETIAIKQTFGHYADRVLVSSTKSMTGHLLAGAGAVEMAFSLMAIQGQFVPPTINLDFPDPQCDLAHVAHQARTERVRIVMSNAFAFGGQNSVVIVAGYE